MQRFFITLLTLFLLVSASGCKKSSSGDDDSSNSSSGAEIDLQADCGIVVDDDRLFSINQDEQRDIESIDVISSELVIVRSFDPDSDSDDDSEIQTQLVMLQGVSTNGVQDSFAQRGTETIEDLVRFGGTFVSAGDDCEVRTDSSGTAVVGQLFSRSGQSVIETLLEQGNVVAASDPCGGDQLFQCYSNIEAQEPESRFSITRFLWKPISERDGNLVILADVSDRSGRSTDVTIEVNRRTLTDFGPSNSFDHTQRANRPGCSFGSATVRVTDQFGAPVLYEGSETIEISNGCDRVELGS